MMVKSISPSFRGQYNKRKKKVWIKLNEDESDDIEYEAEIVDFFGLNILMYCKKGYLVLYEKQRHQINLLV
jgi:hypothetical protein